jgi:uncharacterized protein (TIGR00255 family)
MRENEGEMLKNELNFRLTEIENRVPRFNPESDKVADEYRQRLTKRISEFLAKSESQIDIDQARLAQEVAYLADRSDISEEIQRLKSHIEHFRQIMTEGSGSRQTARFFDAGIEPRSEHNRLENQ